MDSTTEPDAFTRLLDALASYSYFLAIVGFIVWLLMALLAAWVAPDDRPMHFFWCTFLLLGPVGVAVALLAEPREYINVG